MFSKGNVVSAVDPSPLPDNVVVHPSDHDVFGKGHGKHRESNIALRQLANDIGMHYPIWDYQ